MSALAHHVLINICWVKFNISHFNFMNWLKWVVRNQNQLKLNLYGIDSDYIYGNISKCYQNFPHIKLLALKLESVMAPEQTNSK